MKDYIKKQYTGNENGWDEPIKEISTHRITEDQAAELNSHFRNTGTKYELAGAKEKATAKEADADNTAGDKTAETKPKRVRPSRSKAKA